MRRMVLAPARWMVVPLALGAALLGAAGIVTMALERRLADAIPGELLIRSLHYNPLTGSLRLHDVHIAAVSAALTLSADAVHARVALSGLLAGRLALSDVDIVAPRLAMREWPASGLVDGLADVLSEHRATSVTGLVLTGGSVRLERRGAGAEPLVLRDVHARLDRLPSGTHRAPAFVAAVGLDGAEMHVTGHAVAGDPTTAGYIIRLRARDVDLAALQRGLLHGAGGIRLEHGRGDVDAELLAVAGRLVMSGRVRFGPLVAHVAAPAVSRLRADEAVVAVDRFDLGAAAGRVSRLEVRSPSLTVRVRPGGSRELRRLGAALPDVVVRRLHVSDGAVTLVDRDRRLALRGLHVALQAREQAGGASLRLAVTGVADGRPIGLERTLPGAHAGLASGLVEIVHAVERALAR